MRNKVKIKWLFLFAIMILSDLESICQPAPGNRYCYYPQNAEAVVSSGNIKFYVSAFDPINLNKTVLTVKQANGNLFGNQRIIFTLNAIYPSGKILDFNLNNGNAQISYISFIQNTDSAAIYANLINNNQTAATAGPITFYNSRGMNKYIFDALCAAKNLKIDPATNRRDYAVRIASSGPKDSVLKNEMLHNYICPTDDALTLIKSLNPDLADKNILNAGSTLYLPRFPKVSESHKESDARQFEIDNTADSSASELFIQRSNDVQRFIGSMLEKKSLLDNSEDDRELREVLQRLSRSLNGSDKIGYGIIYSTATILSSELISLHKVLIYNLTTQPDSDRFHQYKDILESFSEDFETLLSPYQSLGFFQEYGQLQYALSGPHTSTGQISFENPPKQNEQKDDRYFSSDGSRNINFYVFTIDSNKKAITDSSVFNSLYDVYCLPVAIFGLFKRNIKKLGDLSEFKCSRPASVSNQNLNLTRYYIFAVSLASGTIVSNRDNYFDIEKIPKESSNGSYPRPYAYPIKIDLEK